MSVAKNEAKRRYRERHRVELRAQSRTYYGLHPKFTRGHRAEPDAAGLCTQCGSVVEVRAGVPGHKAPPPVKRMTLEERFWPKVDRTTPNGCWVWVGTLLKTGYGAFTIWPKTVRAHRLAYELVVGPIPDGLHIDHLCRNRACVNPAHLEPVTSGENTRRGVLAKTHCRRGLHAWVEENIRRHRNGARQCRLCANQSMRDSQRRRRITA